MADDNIWEADMVLRFDNRRLCVALAAMTLALAVAGCPNPGSGGGDDAGTDAFDDDRPPVSSRSDRATILFSASGPDSPDASAQNAAFSPEGDRIVFTRFANGYNAGPAELWIVNVDGAGAHRITALEDQDNVNVPGPAWNAANDEIVFASDREEADDIWAIHPDGTGLRRITMHTPPPYWIEPVWSPNGEWIVFESDSEAPTELEQRGTIFKVRSDGTELTQLTKRDGEDFDDRLPNWSPAGDRILFQRRIPTQGDGDTWDVYTIDADGDDLINISNGPEFFNTDNSWSPDGRWIASSSEYPVDGDQLLLPNIVGFFVPDPDSGQEVPPPVRITFSDGHEDGAPSVSPDGQWTAFESHRTSDEQSPADLWIIRTPESLLPAMPSQR